MNEMRWSELRGRVERLDLAGMAAGLLEMLTSQGKHRYEAARMIEETVRGWDGAELSARLEKETGADLQYIRLNGTLVGGLAGLLIYWFFSNQRGFEWGDVVEKA